MSAAKIGTISEKGKKEIKRVLSYIHFTLIFNNKILFLFFRLFNLLAMHLKKKSLVVLTIVSLVVLGIAASRPPDGTHKNLKVLPKNISHDDLDKIMDQWKTALGVKCNFCHAAQKDNPRKMDFASDEKAEKNIAREMFKMTNRINKKFFNYKKTAENPVPPVGCMTCHHGNAHPEAPKATEEKKAENK